MSGFDAVLGNDGDPRTIVYYHEQLYTWLIGKAEFLSPAFFYPQKYVLGYNEGFLLNLVPYSIFRACGIDPFLSFQLCIIAGSALCFFASVSIFVRYLRVRFALALVGAALLTFTNGLYLTSSHPQLYAVYYLPALMLIVLRGLEDFPRATPRLLIHLAAGSALFGLLFATGYYTAWMSAFTCLIAVAVLACCAWRDVLALVRANTRPVTLMVGVSFAAFVIGLIPFVIIYAPVFSSLTPRPFIEAVGYAPFPKDSINVSVFNGVWGWLVERVRGNVALEAAWAVTPGVAITFLWLSWRALRGDLRARLAPWEVTLIGVAAAVSILATVITTRIGTATPYWFVYHLVPGAKAIRAIGRIQLIVNVWVVFGLIVLLDRVWRIPTQPVAKRVLWAILLCFFLVEQINVLDNGTMTRRLHREWLAKVPPPLPECRSFFVAASRTRAAPIDMFPVNADALWISDRTRLPTINGVTGTTPPGFRLDDPSIDYIDAVKQWIALHHLDHVCAYDRTKREWSIFIP